MKLSYRSIIICTCTLEQSRDKNESGELGKRAQPSPARSAGTESQPCREALHFSGEQIPSYPEIALVSTARIRSSHRFNIISISFQ